MFADCSVDKALKWILGRTQNLFIHSPLIVSNLIMVLSSFNFSGDTNQENIQNLIK